MKFLKENLSTIVLITIAAVWIGISLGTNQCPTCLISNIASSIRNDETEKQANPKPASWASVDTTGQTIRSEDLNGKVSVVVYWATWCGGCKKEIPELVKLRNEFDNSKLEILGLSVDKTSKDLNAFTKEYGINYRIARVNASVDNAFGRVKSIPTLFILDQKGRIQFRHTGNISQRTLSKKVSSLLAIDQA